MENIAFENGNAGPPVSPKEVIHNTLTTHSLTNQNNQKLQINKITIF